MRGDCKKVVKYARNMAVVQELCLVVLEKGVTTCSVFSGETTLHFEVFKKYETPTHDGAFQMSLKEQSFGNINMCCQPVA